MTGKTHMLGGIAMALGTTAIIETVVPEQQDTILTCIFVTSSMFAALLPDVDEKHSIAGRNLVIIPLVLSLLKLTLFISGIFLTGERKEKITKARKSLKHRGILHWLITWGIITAILTIISVVLMVNVKGNTTNQFTFLIIAFMAGITSGYLSHILLDIISGKIQLLAPFNEKWYGIRIFKVNGCGEIFLFRPLMIIANIALIMLILKK